MARIDNLSNYLTDVSSAIKNKLGDQTPIPAEQFDTKIASIPSGGGGGGPVEYTGNIKIVFCYIDTATHENKELVYKVAKGSTVTPPDDVGDTERLIFQGWNQPEEMWTNIQYDAVIMAHYTTKSGLLELRLDFDTQAALQYNICVDSRGQNYFTIDWGDGTGEKSSGGVYSYDHGHPLRCWVTIKPNNAILDRWRFLSGNNSYSAGGSRCTGIYFPEAPSPSIVDEVIIWKFSARLRQMTIPINFPNITLDSFTSDQTEYLTYLEHLMIPILWLNTPNNYDRFQKKLNARYLSTPWDLTTAVNKIEALYIPSRTYSKIAIINIATAEQAISSQQFRTTTLSDLSNGILETMIFKLGDAVNLSLNYAFYLYYDLKTLIIDSEIPVKLTVNASLPSGVRQSGGGIYVRDDQVETYKTMTNWTYYALNIKGISEYRGVI